MQVTCRVSTRGHHTHLQQIVGGHWTHADCCDGAAQLGDAGALQLGAAGALQLGVGLGMHSWTVFQQPVQTLMHFVSQTGRQVV